MIHSKPAKSIIPQTSEGLGTMNYHLRPNPVFPQAFRIPINTAITGTTAAKLHCSMAQHKMNPSITDQKVEKLFTSICSSSWF